MASAGERDGGASESARPKDHGGGKGEGTSRLHRRAAKSRSYRCVLTL